MTSEPLADAITRSRAVERSVDPGFRALLKRCPAGWIPDLEERVAVREFDGGVSRERAEYEVAEGVAMRMSQRGKS